MSLISSGLTLAVYWIGAYMIQQAAGMTKLTLFSDMIVFSSYAMQVVAKFCVDVDDLHDPAAGDGFGQTDQ